MDAVKLDAGMCPHCGGTYDSAVSLDHREKHPSNGAVNICGTCGGLSIFQDGRPRLPTHKELLRAMTNEEVLLTMSIWCKTMLEFLEQERMTPAKALLRKLSEPSNA